MILEVKMLFTKFFIYFSFIINKFRCFPFHISIPMGFKQDWTYKTFNHHYNEQLVF